MDGLILLILFLLAVAIYFLPTFIAFKRNKKNKVAVFILNFLLGWTFVGWVVALVWAFTKEGAIDN